MMKNRFNDLMQQVLLDAGWKSNRKQDDLVSSWENELEEKEGWAMFPIAKRILLEFGGLTIVPPSKSGIRYAPDSFEINPSLVVGEKDIFDVFESKIEGRLYPLGVMRSGMAFLAIDENGKVYQVMHVLKLIGNTFDEALENLVFGEDYVENSFN